MQRLGPGASLRLRNIIATSDSNLNQDLHVRRFGQLFLSVARLQFELPAVAGGKPEFGNAARNIFGRVRAYPESAELWDSATGGENQRPTAQISLLPDPPDGGEGSGSRLTLLEHAVGQENQLASWGKRSSHI